MDSEIFWKHPHCSKLPCLLAVQPQFRTVLMASLNYRQYQLVAFAEISMTMYPTDVWNMAGKPYLSNFLTCETETTMSYLENTLDKCIN